MSPPAHETLVLSRTEVEYLAALARGEARPFHTLREPVEGGMVGVRGAAWPDRALLGVKVSGFFLANRQEGLDSHQAVVVQDPAGGRAQALVDGNHVTWPRAACSSSGTGSRPTLRSGATRGGWQRASRSFRSSRRATTPRARRVTRSPRAWTRRDVRSEVATLDPGGSVELRG